MSPPKIDETLSAEQAPQVWLYLKEQAEGLVAAWETGSGPPDLNQYLPAAPAPLRILALIELIKVDLGYRWQRKLPKLLEQYLAEFPELTLQTIPCDLIYEEYHVRTQAGEALDQQQYFTRFPAQETELKRLLKGDAPHHTTALFAQETQEKIEFGQQIDDFDLLSLLGKGAFASVFLARQRSMQRLVALKISTGHSDEPQTMAQLDHPHIVRVFDQRVLPERKLRLLYMQYIPGGTLQGVVDAVRNTPVELRSGKLLLKVVDQALLDRGESPSAESLSRRRLSEASWPEAVCWIGSRLASALDYAHQRGVLHRDLKPANVLVGADASPKLADFNVSFSSKLEGATPAAYFGGSLAYMSPEQLEASNPAHERQPEDVDARSDIYSLGVLLWELCTGNRPFRDESLEGGWTQTLQRIADRRAAGLPPGARAQLPAEFPAGMDQVLMKCLAPSPADRFATAGQLARQLQMCLQPKVQRLFRPKAGSWRQFARNHPKCSLVLAAILPNLLAGGLNIAYNWTAIISQLTPAEQELFQNVQLAVINGVVYSTAIAAALTLIWPVLRAVGRMRAGETVDPVELPRLREACLRLGDVASWVSLAGWIFSGVAFPLWIKMAVGPESALETRHYLHFMVSQILCGLIASTLCFFLVTFLSVRFLYPTLTQPDATAPEAVDGLMRLMRRLWLYYALAVSAPFLAVTVLVLIDTQLRLAFGVLSGVGLAGFGLAFRLSRVIQEDAAALAIAMSPAGESFDGSGSDLSDSFWSSSRR